MQNPEFQSSNQPPLDQKWTKNRFFAQHILVTGGASGIGYAAVERFASDGARVTILDTDAESGEQAVHRLKSEGFQNVDFIVTDVADQEACKNSVLQAAQSGNGTINALVNAAAYFGSKGEAATLLSRSSTCFRTAESCVIQLNINSSGLTWMYSRCCQYHGTGVPGSTPAGFCVLFQTRSRRKQIAEPDPDQKSLYVFGGSRSLHGFCKNRCLKYKHCSVLVISMVARV